MIKFPKHFSNPVVIGVIALLFIGGSFYLGRVNGIQSQKYLVSVNEVTNKTEGQEEKVDFSLFWKTWSLLNEKYVATHASTTDTTKDRVYGAIQGMVASLGDPYTVYFPPVESQIFKSEISGNFDGIGLEVGLKQGIIVAVSPLKGSPAEKAGVLTGDIIAKIDGKSTEGLSLDAAVKLIRGKKGTVVTLTLIRDDNKGPFDVKITRDTINLPTVETQTLKDGTFVIQLYNFSEKSPDLFRDALKQFVVSGNNKLILDLRGNPGGYLEAAVDIASWFLPAEDVVVKEDFGKGKNTKDYTSSGYNIFNENLKMVILVDGGSASASEILAGALSEHGIAKLVGEKTFGKGSVQELVTLSDDSALKVTIARWLTPKGKTISEQGITPDFIVKRTPEDIKNKKDTQLIKAQEVLNAMR